MDFVSYQKRMTYLLELVKNGSAPSPRDLGERFDCSERTVRRMINNLKIQGHPISYSKKSGKYLLEN